MKIVSFDDLSERLISIERNFRRNRTRMSEAERSTLRDQRVKSDVCWGRDVTANLVCARVLSWLDYCNAVLAGLPNTTIERPPQCVIDAAVCSRDHVPAATIDIHWPPVETRTF